MTDSKQLEVSMDGSKDYTAVQDSGERQSRFGTGSVRDTQEGKPRIDLIPPLFIRRLGMHFANGAKKYGDNNWRKGQPLSQYYTSGMRHMLAWFEGQEDEDHFAAAMWNVGCAMWTLEEVRAGRLPASLDDRQVPVLAPLLTDISGATNAERHLREATARLTEQQAPFEPPMHFPEDNIRCGFCGKRCCSGTWKQGGPSGRLFNCYCDRPVIIEMGDDAL